MRKLLHVCASILCIIMFGCNVMGQIISTIAGGVVGHGGFWGDGGPATAAEFSTIANFVVDVSGNIYIADVGNRRIRKVDGITGIVNTVAGTGATGYSPDGTPATAAMFKYPCNVTIDTVGNLYIQDCYDYRIRKVDIATGLISTFAGNGIYGYAGDGSPATTAQLNCDGFSCWDRFGNMYLAEGHKIRKISPSGIITNVAGTGMPGATGEGVPATATNIFPSGIGTDYMGNIYVGDTTGAIRKISISTGVITKVAGTGDNILSPYTGDGIAATSCNIGPSGIAVDSGGNIYVADIANSRAEKINAMGIINSIAGTGVLGFSGDGGPATNATFNYLENIALDKCGNVYLADFGNRRLRKIAFNPTCAPLRVNTQCHPADISIYPNPIKYELHVENAQARTSYQICNLVGSVAQCGSLKQGNNTIFIKHLPSGMYLLLLTDEEGKRTVHKVVKE